MTRLATSRWAIVSRKRSLSRFFVADKRVDAHRTMGTVAPPRLSACCIPIRKALKQDTDYNYEILCALKRDGLHSFAGSVVFPGGTEEEVDRDPFWRDLADVDDRAPRLTAIRETFEECTMLCAAESCSTSLQPIEVTEWASAIGDNPNLFKDFVIKNNITIDIEKLIPLARFVTPKFLMKRFDTHFYLVDTKNVPEQLSLPEADGKEITRIFWTTPNAVLKRFEAGEVHFAPPQWYILKLLSRFPYLAHLQQCIPQRGQVVPFCPHPIENDDDGSRRVVVLALPGDEEHDTYPGRHGDRHRIRWFSGESTSYEMECTYKDMNFAETCRL